MSRDCDCTDACICLHLQAGPKKQSHAALTMQYPLKTNKLSYRSKHGAVCDFDQYGELMQLCLGVDHTIGNAANVLWLVTEDTLDLLHNFWR